MNKTPVLIVFLLIMSMGVLADYSYYPEYGNNGKFSGTYSEDVNTGYQQIDVTSSGEGVTTPIIFDADNDGTSEVFIPLPNGIGVSRGDDPGNFLNTFGNTQTINPVACDIDNDGRLDYVTTEIINNDTYFIAANFAGGVFQEFAFAGPIATTSPYGNMVCSQFYNAQGDTKNYVLWVSLNKTVQIASVVSGVALINTVSVLDAESQEQTNGSYGWGSHEVVIKTDLFGNNGFYFYSGTKAYAYSSNGQSRSISLFPNGYDPGNKHYASIHVRGPVDFGTEEVLYQFDGDIGDGSPATAGTYYWAAHLSVFPIPAMVRGSQLYIPGINAGAQYLYNDMVSAPTAYGKLNLSQNDDSLVTVMYGVNHLTGITSQNGYEIFKSNGVTSTFQTLGLGVGTGSNKTYGVFLADADRDGSMDLIQTRQVSAGVQSFGYATSASNFSNFITIANLSTSNDDRWQLSPIVADMNRDGHPDFIINSRFSGETIILLSTAFGGSTPGIAFTVTLNNTLAYASIQKITTLLNSSDFSYNYAAICDLREGSVWNELFGLSYNFSSRNVSTNVVNEQNRLTFQGFDVTINASQSQLNILKEANFGVRDTITLRTSYTVIGNNTMDIIAFASDSQITSYFRVNKTGTLVQVIKVVFGGDDVSIGNFTSNDGILNLGFIFEPLQDTGGQYFGVTVKQGNTTIGDTATSQFTGTNIDDVELFSDTEGRVIIRQIGLFRSYDPTPGFVNFQNGQRTTVNGVTVTNPPPVPSINGDGFTVLPDYNNVFYTRCDYTTVGTFTQRHFLASTGVVNDYSHYLDLVVTITNETISPEAAGGDGSGDILTDLIPSFLDSIGFHTAASRFFAWVTFILIIGILVGILGKNFLYTALIFVVGMIIGALPGVALVPFWVVLIFVILCAGIVAVGYRVAFTGS